MRYARQWFKDALLCFESVRVGVRARNAATATNIMFNLIYRRYYARWKIAELGYRFQTSVAEIVDKTKVENRSRTSVSASFPLISSRENYEYHELYDQ